MINMEDTAHFLYEKTFLRGYFSERGLRVFFGYVLVFAGVGVILKLIRQKLNGAEK